MTGHRRDSNGGEKKGRKKGKRGGADSRRIGFIIRRISSGKYM